MKLEDIQTCFQDHIIRHDHQMDDAFKALYKQDDITLDQRFSIYRDNIIGGLSAILMEIFPTINALTGKDFTNTLLRAYIRHNLPQSGCLDEYGGGLPDFIDTYNPAASVPYLSDIARFDWALSACEHSLDDAPLTPQDMATFQTNIPEYLPLRTSCFLFSSPYPLPDIKSFAANPDDLPPPKLDDNPAHLLIYRPALKAEYLKLTDIEFFFLTRLHHSLPLMEAVEDTLRYAPSFDFAKTLQNFTMRGVFRKAEI